MSSAAAAAALSAAALPALPPLHAETSTFSTAADGMAASAARARWRLARALLLRGGRDDDGKAEDSSRVLRGARLGEEEKRVSVRRHSGFGLLHLVRHGEQVAAERAESGEAAAPPEAIELATVPLAGGRGLLLATQFARRSAATELRVARESGVDNTGNVCIWPSEEALAYVAARLAQRGAVPCARVAELGAGMAGLAGLYLAATCGSAVQSVWLSDGNPLAAACLAQQVRLNSALWAASSTHAWASPLKWSESLSARELPVGVAPGSVDLLLVSDCLFFTEYHAALLHTIDLLLEPLGVALLLCPRRGNTLRRFVELARATGGWTVLEEDEYDAEVAARHARFLAKDPDYAPDLHFPVLVTLRRARR
jgi:calmodulin-lysine N-methyltransferase